MGKRWDRDRESYGKEMGERRERVMGERLERDRERESYGREMAEMGDRWETDGRQMEKRERVMGERWERDKERVMGEMGETYGREMGGTAERDGRDR